MWCNFTKQLYKPLSPNWSTGWVSTSLKQVQTDMKGGFTDGLRCLHYISLRLNVPNKPATGVWISSGQPALQCVNSATRGRSTLLSPATSLCVWTWRKTSSLHCYIWPTVRTLRVYVCVRVWNDAKTEKQDEQKPAEGGGVNKKTDSDRLAASCWRTVTVEGLFCWDPSSPSHPRVCRSPPGSSSPRHEPEQHNHTWHQRQLQLMLFRLNVCSSLISGIFPPDLMYIHKVWCISLTQQVLVHYLKLPLEEELCLDCFPLTWNSWEKFD